MPFATQSVPVGGNAAVLFSAELRIHADYLLNHLGIVTFVDASQVSDDPRRPLLDGLEVAPGLGLRYITPFGPIRFDVAWLANPKDVATQPLTASDPANPANTINVTRADRASPRSAAPDTPGCIHESRFAFHLTLGEAF